MANLNGNGTLVKKKWELIYDLDPYYDLGFSENEMGELYYHPSLEQMVSSYLPGKRGITDNEKHFTTNHCPEFISSTISYLRGKHENIRTQANVERHLSRAGMPILQRIPGLKEIREKRKLAYEIGNEPDRLRIGNISRYDLRYHLSITDVRKTVYTLPWVGAGIAELASDLNVSLEIIVIQALISGMATSEKWIPSRYRGLIIDEMIRFANWVRDLSERV